MVPFGADLVTLKLELNQSWPEGAPAGIEDEIEYWMGPQGLFLPPEWRLLSLQVREGWIQALREEGRLLLGGHVYEIYGDTVLPEGQLIELVRYENEFYNWSSDDEYLSGDEEEEGEDFFNENEEEDETDEEVERNEDEEDDDLLIER